MLTEKEIEVLKLRKEGFLQSEVSSKLQISQPAVSDFERNAKRKIEEANSENKCLTEKEIEVLELRKKGFIQSEIASKLKISQPAVSDFERNAKRKLAEAMEIIKLVKEIGLEKRGPK